MVLIKVPDSIVPYEANIPQQYTRTFKDYLKDIRFLNYIVQCTYTGAISYQVPQGFTLFLTNAWSNGSSQGLGGTFVNETVSIVNDPVGFADPQILIHTCLSGTTAQSMSSSFNVPIVVNQGKYIFCDHIQNANSSIRSGFAGVLVSNSEFS